MTVANLPTMEINCGQPFVASILFAQDGVAVDISSWSGRFSVSTEYNGATIVEVTPSLSALGVILVELTDAQTLTLQPYPNDCLVFQIDIAGASEAHRMQGKVKIYPEIGS